MKNYNERELKKEYGIETKLIPQQVVERDPNYSESNSKKYVINKERAKNNFKLLLSQGEFKISSEDENFADLNEAMIHNYKPKGWYIYDFLTVVAHLTFIILIGSPAIVLIIFVRVLNFDYTMIPF